MALTEAQKLARAGKLIDRCIPEPNTGCWLWEGSLKNNGYGHLVVREGGVNSTFLAHRLSYETFNGTIPDGMVVMHSCDIKICVNPDHLKVGTQQENVADCIKKNRRAKPKKFCKNGHNISENFIRRGSGRRCSVCSKLSFKRWYDAN